MAFLPYNTHSCLKFPLVLNSLSKRVESGVIGPDRLLCCVFVVAAAPSSLPSSHVAEGMSSYAHALILLLLSFASGMGWCGFKS